MKRVGKRKITTMRLDEDLTKKAHDLGLNVSKICENALKNAIECLEGDKTETNDGNALFGEAFSLKRFCGAPAGIWTRVSGSKGRNT